MNVRVCALALVVALAGCHSSATEPTETTSQAIIGGTDDSMDPAVVSMFVDSLKLSLCSGVLIGPRMVLTAGHCSFGTNPVSVHFGLDAYHPDRSITTVARAIHPKFTAEGAPYDFALFELETAVTDIAPLPLRTTPLAQSDVGKMVRHIGYGVSDEAAGTGGGTKRTVTYPITRVDDTMFYSGAPGKQTCDFDSGGPGLVTEGDGIERVAGIVSDGPNCHEDGWDGRTDLAELASFVTDTQTTWDMPPPPDAGTSDTPAPSNKSGCATAREAPRSDAFLIALAVMLALGAAARTRRKCVPGT